MVVRGDPNICWSGTRCKKFENHCPIWIRNRVSSPSRSHFSLGLKLILRTQVTNPEIATFQSLSKGVYDMCIYMFICSELIEETGRPPGLILAWLGQVRVRKFFHTFDGVMT